MSSCLTMNQRNVLTLVTNETVRLWNKTRSCLMLLFLFNFLFNEQSRPRLNQIYRFRKLCRNQVDCHVLVFTGADQKFNT